MTLLAALPLYIHIGNVCKGCGFTNIPPSQTPLPTFSPHCQICFFTTPGDSGSGEHLNRGGLMEKQLFWASCFLIPSRADFLSPFLMLLLSFMEPNQWSC